jgi:cell volume regulation protein A
MAFDVISVFGVISAIIFIGFIAEYIFKKTKIPDVLFLIGFGVLMSSGLNWLGRDTFSLEATILFTTFTLVFIIFQGALSVDLKTLFLSLKGTLKLTVISFFFTAIVIAIVAYVIIGYNILLSLLLGFILGGSCSATIIPLLSHMNINKEYNSIIILESAINDVLGIIGTITIIAIVTNAETSASLIVKNILSSFFLAAVIGSILGIIWIFFLSKSKILRESYMVTIAFILGLYAFIESSYVEANGAIAALAFGLILGNSTTILNFFYKISKRDENETRTELITESVLSDSAQNFYIEISFFVKVLFFVLLGIIMDFSNIFIFIYGLLITAAFFLIRPLAVKLSFLDEKVDDKSLNALKILIPKGLTAAVLAQVAIQKGIPNEGNFVNIVFAVVIISIVITSILVFISQRKFNRLEQNKKQIQKTMNKKGVKR